MPKNPNVPYDVNPKYVSLPASDLVTALMKVEDYKAFEVKFAKLSGGAKDKFCAIAGFEPSKFHPEMDNPYNKMSPVSQDAFKQELKNAGIGFFDNKLEKIFRVDRDEGTIGRDIRSGKQGFTTPVYSVAGKSVIQQLFDDAGNLSRGVAEIYGVPSDRSEAIFKRAGGIRKDLIGTVKESQLPVKPQRGMRM